MFVNTVLNFLIVALAVFLFVVKPANRFTKKEAPTAPATKPCPFCATDIPLAATRCPHYTSQLNAPAPA
jgi:large conductance mechanosensitive channel